MAPYYRIVSSTDALSLDKTLLEELEKANVEELTKLDERVEDAKKQEGESDIADALRAKANYYTKIGDKVCLHTCFAIVLWLIAPCIIGESPGGPESRTREDRGFGVADRRGPHHHPDRTVLR